MVQGERTMNKAEEFNDRVRKEVESYTTDKVYKYFAGKENGDSRDRSYHQEVLGAYNGHTCLFYHYMACAARLSNTIDAVELGADRGASALFIQSEISGTLYSVDLQEPTEGGASDGWMYVPKKMTNIVKVVGSSIEPLTLGFYDLSKAKFWLIDSKHTDEQFEIEMELYKDRWTKGTVVICDDIKSTYRPWQKLPYDKYEDLTGSIHGNGVGMFIV